MQPAGYSVYWQYTTAPAFLVLAATNPETKTVAVSTNVSFAFIAIPRIGDFMDLNKKRGDMFDCGPTITSDRRREDKATSYFASFSFAMTSSRLKLAAFCR
jgi:hypothetical protein